MDLTEREPFRQIVKRTLEKLLYGGDEIYEPWQQLLILNDRRAKETLRQAVRRCLREGLECLRTENELHAALIEGSYFTSSSFPSLYDRHHLSRATAYDYRKKGIERLADLIAERERKARRPHRAQMLERLPNATYSRFIGRDELVPSFAKKIMAPGVLPIMSIEGMGGLGKTSLVRELMVWLFDAGQLLHMAWVSGQQQFFHPAGRIEGTGLHELTDERLLLELRRQLGIGTESEMSYIEAIQRVERHLQQQPHLIVVDNFETVHELKGVMGLLLRLAEHCRFLLTTREGLSVDQPITSWSLPELTLPLTQEFLLTYSGERVRQGLRADPQKIEQIFDVVGGNPLALRLLVGQLETDDLPRLLHELRHAKGKMERLYHYLFDNIWQSLTLIQQDVCLVMPFVARSGVPLEELATFSGYDLDVTRMAVESLKRRNLIDVVGALDEPRYTVHNLTRTFLEHKGRGLIA